MSITTAAPPSARPVSKVGPSPHRWTIEEYRQLRKTGLFNDCKTMLIEGEILTMTMPAPPHDTALGLTENYLRQAFPSGCHVRNQMGFDIGTRNDPGPDLAVVPGSIRDYARRTPDAAVLVVEIADSSFAFDTTTKAELYATAGVPEYWVVDLEGRRLTIFRDPLPLPAGLGATAYRTRIALAADATAAPLAAPHAVVCVADLLP